MSSRKELPSIEYLRQVLDYNPETGIFVWKDRFYLKPRTNNRLVGKIAGYINNNGYVRIKIDQSTYSAHRLAFYLMHKEAPIQIDHINCIKHDNRISNLRSADNSKNKANTRKSRNNSSGFKGVSFFKQHKKWRADIAVDKKSIYLGMYDTKEEAYDAYCKKAHEYFGEFARFE